MEKTPERKALEEQAKELGIKQYWLKKDEKLAEEVNSTKKAVSNEKPKEDLNSFNPSEWLCCRRKYQGFMIYIKADLSWFPGIDQFFDRFGCILFPAQEFAEPKKLVPTDRFWGREREFFLDEETEGATESIKDAVFSFQQWIDRQGGVAPCGAECDQKSYEYAIMAQMEGSK